MLHEYELSKLQRHRQIDINSDAYYKIAVQLLQTRTCFHAYLRRRIKIHAQQKATELDLVGLSNEFLNLNCIDAQTQSDRHAV